MKNLFNIIFSPKIPINGKQYLLINLGIFIIEIIIMIVLIKLLGLSILKTLNYTTDNEKDYLFILIITGAISFYPSVLSWYKRIKDTNLNIYVFYILLFSNILFYLYFIICYFKEGFFNDLFVNLTSLIIALVIFFLAFAPSKNKIIKEDKNEEILTDIENNSKIKFFPVKPLKFFIMSFFTFGFYEMYWFYKNFKYIKENYPDSKNIWPFIRSIFALITGYFFLKKLFYKNVDLAVGISILYFILSSCGRSDSSYFIIGLFSSLALLPAVFQINKINNSKENEIIKNDKKYNFNLLNYIYLLITVPISILIVSINLYIIPSSSNVKGSELWFWQKNYLSEQKYIDSLEKLEYFYSEGFPTIKGNGIIITDKSVSIYSNSKGQEAIFNKEYYKNIDRINIEKEKYNSYTNVIEFIPKNKYEGSFYILLDNGENYDKILDYLKTKINENK